MPELLAPRRPINRWALVSLLLAVGFLCQIGFVWRQRILPPSLEIPDVRFGYSPADLDALFKAWGEEGRHLYAVTQLTLDVAFPLAYGVLMATCLSGTLPAGRWRRLARMPLAAAGADLVENVVLAYLAWDYEGRESSLAWAAAALTILKQCALLASLVMLGVGGLVRLRRVEQPLGHGPEAR
jgi:hypothetical protein